MIVDMTVTIRNDTNAVCWDGEVIRLLKGAKVEYVGVYPSGLTEIKVDGKTAKAYSSEIVYR